VVRIDEKTDLTSARHNDPPNDNGAPVISESIQPLHADRDEPGSSSTDSEPDDPTKWRGEILTTNTFGSEP
jgi:hypothetical protein